MARADVMYNPTFEGDWSLDSIEYTPLVEFTLNCGCTHKDITEDLVFQVYEDGMRSLFKIHPTQ